MPAGTWESGVVPNAGWNSTYKAIQVGNAGAVWSEDASSSNTLISNNEVYNTNGSYYRLVAGAANDILLQNNGSFQFRSTATSAAANSIISDQTTKMTLDASGYLAIGTSSTGFNGQGLPLVVGSGTGSTGMTIFSGADSYGTLQFADAVTTGAASYAGVVSYNHTSNFMYFSTASTERMRIDSSGNVGIGTGSPTAITNYTTVTVNGTTGGVLDFENGEVLNSRLVGEAGGLVVSGEGSRYIKFHTNNAERMRISSSGNLLVGTTDSDMSNNSGTADGFSVLSSGIITNAAQGITYYANRLGSDGGIIDFRKDGTPVGSIGVDSGDNLYIGGSAASHSGLYFGTHTAAPITAGTLTDAVTDLGTAGYRFKDLYLSGGVVGGAINASLGLHNSLGSDNGSQQSFWADSGGTTYQAGYQIHWNTGSNNARTTKMVLDASGNLLVGTTATGFQNSNALSLEPSGGYTVINHASGSSTGSYYAAFGYNAVGIGSITQSGTTAVLYNTTSDERLKENIADADDAGSKIDSIQVRKFDWKADGSHQDYGMVAQELLEVAPEAVSAPEDPEEMMGVDYSKLVPMMLKEIQSLRARVAALES